MSGGKVARKIFRKLSHTEGRSPLLKPPLTFRPRCQIRTFSRRRSRRDKDTVAKSAQRSGGGSASVAQVWRQAVLSVLFVLSVLSVLFVLSTAAATPPTPSGPSKGTPVPPSSPSKRHNRAPSGPRYRRGIQRSDTTAPLLRSRGHALTGRHVAQRSKTGARLNGTKAVRRAFGNRPPPPRLRRKGSPVSGFRFRTRVWRVRAPWRRSACRL